MGRSTSSDICEHVARVGDPWEDGKPLPDGQDGPINGWDLVFDSYDAGRNGRLYPYLVAKVHDGKLHAACWINEAEYDGRTDIAVFAPPADALEYMVNDQRQYGAGQYPAALPDLSGLPHASGRESVELLLKDFGLTPFGDGIADMDSVQQTC